MLGFIFGCFTGGLFGVVLTCLCAVNAESARIEEKEKRENDKRG